METTNPSDLYAAMLEVKNGKRGWLSVSKKMIRASGIEWAFVENSAAVLGLQLKQHGRHGWTVPNNKQGPCAPFFGSLH